MGQSEASHQKRDRMKLKVLGSSSNGNCYILETDTEALIIEAGINVKEVKQAIGFNVSKVVGCLISHDHGDHIKYAKVYQSSGIGIFTSEGTLKDNRFGLRRAHIIEANSLFQLAGFKVLPFGVEHDAAEPLGFVIQHPDCGTVLFATDTHYLRNRFVGLNNVILEANYSQSIIDDNMANGRLHRAQRTRVMTSHLEFENTKAILEANDLSQVNNIVLIHLSPRNSDAAKYKLEVEQLTGKTVHIAQPGLEIEFNKCGV